MKISFGIQDILDIIIEDVSRLGARSYSEDGASLYDGYRITSRDEGVLSRMLEEKDVRVRELLMFCLLDEVAEEEPPKQEEEPDSNPDTNPDSDPDTETDTEEGNDPNAGIEGKARSVDEKSETSDKEDVTEDVEETLDYIFVDNMVSNSVFRPLKVLLRKYLTDGTLYEWYTRKGIASPITFGDIEALETKMVCLVRQGFIKKPLQPFGPRN